MEIEWKKNVPEWTHGDVEKRALFNYTARILDSLLLAWLVGFVIVGEGHGLAWKYATMWENERPNLVMSAGSCEVMRGCNLAGSRI